MKDLGIIYGSAEQAKPLIIGIDIVYVHTNIHPVTNIENNDEIDNNIFSYHEIQYSKDEYLKNMVEKNTDLENQLTVIQIAFCELFEEMENI